MSSGDRPRKKSLMAIPTGDPRNSIDVVEKSGSHFESSAAASAKRYIVPYSFELVKSYFRLTFVIIVRKAQVN